MDTRPQKYKDALVIFLPLPGHKDIQHSGKEGKILFQQSGKELWWIEFEEKKWINLNTPLQREIKIRVLALETEFKPKI